MHQPKNLGAKMAILTLEQLKLAARQRADKENDTHIGDDELTRYINSSIAELYDLLISAYGMDYFYKEYSVPTVSGLIPLPDDFYQLMGVDLFLSSNNPLNLRQYNFAERNKYKNGVFPYTQNSTNYRYRLLGNNLSIVPDPPSSLPVTIHYVPKATYLEADSDEFDGYNGWEEYVIVNAAIAMLAKEESDTARLDMELGKLQDRISSISNGRNQGEPQSVIDIDRQGWEYY